MTRISRNSTAVLLCFLPSLLCIGVYWPGLDGPSLLDDVSTFGFLFNDEFSLDKIQTELFSPSGPFGRPVAMASFFLNAWLSQDLFYWKLTNLAIHLLTGFVVYVFLRKLVARVSPQQTYLAVAVSAIWLLHPLQVSTVLYTVQRMTQLATLFSVAGLYCYWLARENPIHSKAFVCCQALSWLLFFPLAIFSKETALLFPVFIIVLELFILQKDNLTDKAFNLIVTGLIAIGLVIFCWQFDSIAGGYAIREFTLGERTLTQARVVTTYLGMLLIPAQGRMSFLHDDVVLSTSLLQPWTTAPAAGLLALLLVSALFARKKLPLYSVGLVLFFAGHLLESSVFALELMYEHRNYLPSVGFFLALVSLIDHLLTNKRVLTWVGGCYLALLVFSTWLLADTWGSDIRLYHQIETHHPKSERITHVLASQLINAGAYDLARKKYQSFATLGVKIQHLYIDCKEFKSLKDESFAIDISPFRVADNLAVMGLVDLANLGLDDKCSFSAQTYVNLLDEVLKKTRQMQSNRQMLFMYKAHYQWRLKQKEAAFATLKQGFAVRPENPTPLFLACEWALDENMKATADELCPKALTVAADNAPNFDDLATEVKKRYPAK